MKKKYFRTDRKDISYIKFIFEAYDGIATLSTVDAASGLLVIHIAPGCENEVKMVLDDLKKNIIMEDID